MLATIKIHSAFRDYFTDLEYKADFNTYFDVISYLKAMHPKFNHYMNMIDHGQSEETFALLDSDYKVITQQDLFIKKVKEDSDIYLVPMIVGGGGKRGGLFAVAALVGIGIATGGFGLAATSTTATGVGSATSLVGGTGASAASVVAPTTSSGLFAGFNGIGGFAKSLLGNLAMSFISSLFMKKPKNQQETDQNTREAGMFGNLTNTTQSGTPIALHYGLMRVGGQFLSGYIESEEHGKNDVVKVEDKF